MRKSPIFIILFLLYNLSLSQSISISTQDITNYSLITYDTLPHSTYLPTISYSRGNYFRVLDLEAGLSFNSKYPRGFNDGPIWQGRGATYQFNAGIQAKKGIFNFTFFPVVYHSQNNSFELGGIRTDRNEYSFQFGVLGNIDYVQRYGNKSFTKFHLGQSEVAIRSKILEVALSTQNFILGPARYQSIMMSNSGIGFPHLTIGTPRKIPLTVLKKDVGSVDFQLFYGVLNESNYFDSKKSNDLRYINGFTAAYSIPKMETLSIGISKTMYKNADFFNASDLYSLFYSIDKGILLSSSGDTILNSPNDSFDRMVSFFIDWRIEDQDMRVFFELAKNDFGGSWFLEDFEHSRAYSLGVEKVFPLKTRKLHAYFENTLLIRSNSYLYRASPGYYQHDAASQGYTHHGQLLGAGIGPGSATELLSFNFHDPKGYFGFSFQRIRINEDFYIANIPNNVRKIRLHDAEYSVGGKYFRKLDRFDLLFNVIASYRESMYHINSNDKINLWGNVTVQVPLQK